MLKNVVKRQDIVETTSFFHPSPRYRKVVLNNCTKGVKEMYTARKQQCPNRPPKGLTLSTKNGKLTANLGSNVTFLVHLDEVSTRLTGSGSISFNLSTYFNTHTYNSNQKKGLQSRKSSYKDASHVYRFERMQWQLNTPARLK